MNAYSGRNGLYSCIDIVQQDREALQRFLYSTSPALRPNEFLDNCHITLVHSRSAVSKATLKAFLPECRRIMNASPAFAEYWSGHDNVGYVVLVLYSDALTHAHELLLKCGAQHLHGTYTPHLTLCTNVGPKTERVQQWIDRINVGLCATEMSLRCQTLHFSDLRY